MRCTLFTNRSITDRLIDNVNDYRFSMVNENIREKQNIICFLIICFVFVFPQRCLTTSLRSQIFRLPESQTHIRLFNGSFNIFNGRKDKLLLFPFQFYRGNFAKIADVLLLSQQSNGSINTGSINRLC